MKRLFLAAAGGLALLAALGLQASAGPGLPVEGRSPGFDGAVTWLNSVPLGQQQLRGKVVLVDFWTYSCINCIRTFPYVRAWADKYRSHGLVVVGVHTPEFKFEQDLGNLNTAVRRVKIDFPVAVDSDHRIWEAWGNRYWPALYLVDAHGRIRHHQFGEGGYDKLERAIQSLLAEAGARGVEAGLVAPKGRAEEMAADVERIGSGEAYLGYGKAEHFASPQRLRKDGPQQYSVGALGVNSWGLAGHWNVGAERALALEPGAAVAHQFSARDLHLVMGPGSAGGKVRIEVTIDGRAPGADHGADIDAQGNGVIGATRLYQLVRQAGKVGPRRFEIRFLDRGAEVYAFTFG